MSNFSSRPSLVSALWSRLFFALAILYLAVMPWAPFPGQFAVKSAPVFLLLFPVFKSHLTSRYKILLSLAVLFSAAGDIFLALPFSKSFISGLGAFLFAHLFFIFVNIRWMQWQPKRMVIIVPAVIAAVLFLSSIMDEVIAKNLLIPVIIYALVLVAMTVVSGLAKPERRLLLFGGLAFLLSDCILAYGAFVQSSFIGSFSVMVFYYSSEFLLVSGNLHSCELSNRQS